MSDIMNAAAFAILIDFPRRPIGMVAVNRAICFGVTVTKRSVNTSNEEKQQYIFDVNLNCL